jgi:hypothetical protein
MTLPLADMPVVQSVAIGLMIAGLIIYFWSFRGAVVSMVRRVLGRAESGSDSQPQERVRVARVRESEQAQPLSSVMADAEELAQLLAERMDRQAAKLEQLIAAADQRLANLEKAASQPAPTPRPVPRREVMDPLSRQVYDLSDKGLPPVEIARQLNQQTGKVELILALRQHV